MNTRSASGQTPSIALLRQPQFWEEQLVARISVAGDPALVLWMGEGGGLLHQLCDLDGLRDGCFSSRRTCGIEEVAASHSVYVSQPEAVVAIIEKAASELKSAVH